ncbi:hypothetical protein [Hymenobacter nivis]|uniref:hypothetical protein n=1 Tax=Hymenobacter nivis TaxID=1850093 RepID=UPI001B863498|nr:hypothetical protein [Hymenobacter nivis]
MLLAGTAVLWYVGIVWCNGDLAFTLLNVVLHGVPYLALVWQGRPAAATGAPVPRRGPWAGKYGWLAFLGLIGLFAYLEEELWDGLVWGEHAAVFSWFQALPDVSRAA